MALFLTGAERRTLPVQMFAGIRDQVNPTIMAAATVLLTLSIVLFLASTVLGAWRGRDRAPAETPPPGSAATGGVL